MQMLYNSDQFVVVAFDLAAGDRPVLAAPTPGQAAVPLPPSAGRGFEIVDKVKRKEIFIEGEVALSFQQGVQALAEQGPTEEAMDDFISGFTLLAQQPVVLH